MNTSTANTKPLTAADFQALGDTLQLRGDEFAAYLFKLASYHLSADSTRKLRLGFQVVDLCLHAGRFAEADRMINSIAEDFPLKTSYQNSLRYLYGYNLLLWGEYGRSDLHLRILQDEPFYRNRVLFLRAKNGIVDGRPEDSHALLSRINLKAFAYSGTVVSLMRTIEEGPRYASRSGILAGALSATVPGLGQAYAGHHFDAIQSFIFNVVLGSAAYLSWKYDVLDRDSDDRRYALPIFSTTVWSVFYAANIWNGVNAAHRYNRYKEMQHYEAILERFEVIQEDKNVFLQVSLPFDL
ncbi:MAG: hypothetical protein GF355_15875 [Candidatus Eisenbacteria bacterium]|nr:hypothetical protein [Candidatus Eisenbacteria bacterium]